MSNLYTMMTLGGYQFGISTATYHELRRSTEYHWPSQPRFGSAPAVQFVGVGDETISLPGVIYPEWNGGTGQLDSMRALADRKQPLLMIDGRGNVMGNWVIERVEEGQETFAQGGVARKQNFVLSLKNTATWTRRLALQTWRRNCRFLASSTRCRLYPLACRLPAAQPTSSAP